MKDLIASAVGSGVEVNVDLPDDLWAVDVDVNELEIGLLNMAVNARDAMPGGGRLGLTAVNVTLTGDEVDPDLKGDFVQLTIADTGVGIPADVLPKVVEPFFTTKEVNRGTGLGLSQAYGFAQQSGGRMTIESELGQGTTIRLYLPRAAAQSPQPNDFLAGDAQAPGDTVRRGQSRGRRRGGGPHRAPGPRRAGRELCVGGDGCPRRRRAARSRLQRRRHGR